MELIRYNGIGRNRWELSYQNRLSIQIIRYILVQTMSRHVNDGRPGDSDSDRLNERQQPPVSLSMLLYFYRICGVALAMDFGFHAV